MCSRAFSWCYKNLWLPERRRQRRRMEVDVEIWRLDAKRMRLGAEGRRLKAEMRRLEAETRRLEAEMRRLEVKEEEIMRQEEAEEERLLTLRIKAALRDYAEFVDKWSEDFSLDPVWWLSTEQWFSKPRVVTLERRATV